MQERGVDVATRLHQHRTADFRRGRRLEPGDHLVDWPKPACPDWLDAETYARLPATLNLCAIDLPGDFRVSAARHCLNRVGVGRMLELLS